VTDNQKKTTHDCQWQILAKIGGIRVKTAKRQSN